MREKNEKRQKSSRFLLVCYIVGFLQLLALLWYPTPSARLRIPRLCHCFFQGRCNAGRNVSLWNSPSKCSGVGDGGQTPLLLVVIRLASRQPNNGHDSCHAVWKAVSSLSTSTFPVQASFMVISDTGARHGQIVDCSKNLHTNHVIYVVRDPAQDKVVFLIQNKASELGAKYIAFVDYGATLNAFKASVLEKLVLVLEGKQVDAATVLSANKRASTYENEEKIRQAWLYAPYDSGPVIVRADAATKDNIYVRINQWFRASSAEQRYTALAAIYYSFLCSSRFTVPETLVESKLSGDYASLDATAVNNQCSKIRSASKRNNINPHNRRSAASIHNLISATTQCFQTTPSVLMIVPWLEFGGADEFNLNFARQLAGKGVNIVVSTTLLSAHPNTKHLLKYASDVFHAPHIVASARDLYGILSLWKYVIATRNVELVFVSNSQLGYQMLPELDTLKSKYSLKLVDYVHMEEPEQGRRAHAATSVRYRDYLDHTFVASRHLAQWMERETFKTAGRPRHPKTTLRVSVAYIGVDTDALVPLNGTTKSAVRTQYLGSPSLSTIVIAYVARMEHQKNPGLFFDIARRLLMAKTETTLRDLQFVAIGGGDLLPALQHNIVQHGLEKTIKTFNTLDHDATMRLLGASDILLLPTRNEGISLATYEAMSLGVVPVVSAVGGQCELVDDQVVGACLPLTRGGMDVAADDFVREILERTVPSLSFLASAARQRVVQNFTLEHMIESITRRLCEIE